MQITTESKITIVPRDPDREHRIHYETVADAYNEEERVMGWYYYLQDSPLFPFEALSAFQGDKFPLYRKEKL
jgi:hypothetical protein